MDNEELPIPPEEVDRRRTDSAGTMATIMSSEMDFGRGVDSLGEDLASRAVAVSVVSSEQPTDAMQMSPAAVAEQQQPTDAMQMSPAAVAEQQQPTDAMRMFPAAVALQEQPTDAMRMSAAAWQPTVSEETRPAAVSSSEETAAAAPVVNNAPVIEEAPHVVEVAKAAPSGVSFTTPREEAKIAREMSRHVLRSVYVVAAQDDDCLRAMSVPPEFEGTAVADPVTAEVLPPGRVLPSESMSADDLGETKAPDLPPADDKDVLCIQEEPTDQKALPANESTSDEKDLPLAEVIQETGPPAVRPSSRHREKARQQLLAAHQEGRLQQALLNNKPAAASAAAAAAAAAVAADVAMPIDAAWPPDFAEPSFVAEPPDVAAPADVAATSDITPSEEPDSMLAAKEQVETSAPELETSGQVVESKPCLSYFPFAGRAELARLIASVGGLDIDEKPELDGQTIFGWRGYLPSLEHGEVQLAGSVAIERYIASITPMFANLEPAQRESDNKFCKMKEDLHQAFSDIMMELTARNMSDADKRSDALVEIVKLADKWFAIVEANLPADGFVQGLSLPTVADLAVLNMQKAFVPFTAMSTIAGYDVLGKFPKFAAHVARVAEYPPVKAYLEKSTTMDADPFDLRNVRLAAPDAQTAAAAGLDETTVAETIDGYMRDDSWTLSATSQGRAQQDWAAHVLGALIYKEPRLTKDPIKRLKKKGLKRVSTSSILRSLGCDGAPINSAGQILQGMQILQGSASSPSIGATSIIGQQSSNSIRSQLTSPAESDWMVRNTWTPPSPPAPSSARTGTVRSTGTSKRTDRTDRSHESKQTTVEVPIFSSMPATGFRLSPCNSASSQKALLANLARSEVPGLDMGRVNMGTDDDEDTEDYPTGGEYVSTLKMTDDNGGGQKLVPQLDMTSLQGDGASKSSPSKNSGLRKTQAPRDPSATTFSAALIPGVVRPGSQGVVPASVGGLRPVIPGPRELSTPTRCDSGYTKSSPDLQYGLTVNVNVDTAGSVVAGTKISLDAPAGVRLPPVSKGTKGKKRAIVSHVHMHHHLHYHVKRPEAESDLSIGDPLAGPGVPGAGAGADDV